MTAAVLDRPSASPANGCRYSWCTGLLCSVDSNDNLHKGRPSTVPDERHDYDVCVFPTAFDFDDETSSDPIVEFAVDSADTGCGVYTNCSPGDAYALSAALVAAGSGKFARGQVVTINTSPGPHVSNGTITVELLDESFDVIIGLSGRDLRVPLVKVTVDGDGETYHEECQLFASLARDLGRFVQLTAFEVAQ